MPYSEASYKASQKYRANKIKRVPLDMQIADYEKLKSYSESRSESVNGFIKRAISETMARDGGMAQEITGKPAESTQGGGVVSLPSEALRTAQEAAETGKQPAPVDRAKAWGNILETFSDVGTVDSDKARCECPGIMYLPPDTLEAAQQAAERTGETVVDFVARAVAEQQIRDDRSFKMGINPS